MEFLTVGGDLRLHYAALALIKEGHGVTMRGTPPTGNPYPTGEEYRAANAWLLPMPLLAGERLSGGEGAPEPDRLLSYVRRGVLVFGGRIPPGFRALLAERGARVFDYLDDETLTMENAWLTAEGALAAFMKRSDGGVRGSRCAVVGFGRIARALARALLSLGARVTVFARKEKDRAEAALFGAAAAELMPGVRFAGFDAIFNTVPAPVFSPDSFREAGASTVFELADVLREAPGAAALIRMKGVPGAYAPRAAGACIARAVLRQITAPGMDMV